MASRSAPVSPNDIAKGSLGRLLGGPVASRRAPVDPNEKRQRYTFKKTGFPIETKEIRNLCYHEREAKKMQEQHYKINKKDKVCKNIIAEDIGNR